MNSEPEKEVDPNDSWRSVRDEQAQEVLKELRRGTGRDGPQISEEEITGWVGQTHTDGAANRPTWLADSSTNWATAPALVEGWWDESMSASSWWRYPDVTPIDAALVLCGVNRLAATYRSPEHASEVARMRLPDLPANEPPAETVSRVKRRREAFGEMLTAFESVQRSNPASRTMNDWLGIARQNGLAYDRWVDEWLDARAQLGLPESASSAQHAAQQTVSVKDHLCAIKNMIAALILSGKHAAANRTQIAAAMAPPEPAQQRKGKRSAQRKDEGLSERTLQKIFAAACRGDTSVEGVRDTTVCRATREVYEYLRYGGQGSVPTEDVRKLFAEKHQPIQAPIKAWLAADHRK